MHRNEVHFSTVLDKKGLHNQEYVIDCMEVGRFFYALAVTLPSRLLAHFCGKSYRLSHFLPTLFSTGDSIECNASTFTLEMKETAYILGSLSDDSNALVVIDEACSSFSRHRPVAKLYTLS